MFLHLGEDTVINMKNVVAICDLETTTVTKITKDYLANAQKTGKIINVSSELPKSFVVCNEGDKIYVYISQISARTLFKRTNFINTLSKSTI